MIASRPALACSFLLLAGAALPGRGLADCCPVTQVLRPDPGSPQEGQGFGASIAVQGAWAAIGSPADSGGPGELVDGRVYLHRREGGRWVAVERLDSPLDPEPEFGRDLALSGEWLVVASRGPTLPAVGRVHLFRLRAGAWAHEATIQPGPEVAWDRFGTAVALSGGVLAVLGDTVGGPNLGAVQMHEFVAGEWARLQTLEVDVGSEGTWEQQLALSDDWLVVGVQPDEGAGPSLNATARIYRRDGDEWSLAASLGRPATGTPGSLGVALEGDRVVVGSVTNPPFLAAGSATVYERDAGAWTVAEVLESSTPLAGEGLGWSVALAGDRLLAGAPAPFEYILEQGHGAYLFEQGATGWELACHFVTPRPFSAHGYGMAVALAGHELFIGDTQVDFHATGKGYVEVRNCGIATVDCADGIETDPLQVRHLDGEQLQVSWGHVDQADQVLHAGSLASLWNHGAYDHGALNGCESEGPEWVGVATGDAYFLSTASCGAGTPSYGRDSRGWERPEVTPACH